MVVPLKDAEKFEAFLKKQFPQAKIEAKGDITLATLNENTAIGWNKKTAIVAGAATSYEMGSMPNSSRTILAEEVEKTFAMKEDMSLASNKRFMDLQKAGHDIGFFLNYESFATNMPQEEMGQAGMVLASQKKLLKDAFIAGGLDFEKGKIVGDATYYFNDSVKTIAHALESKSVDNDLLKRMSGSQMNLMMSYHFNPQGIKTMAETMGVIVYANSALKEIGLSMDDVLNAFTGDFLLAVTDFSITTESKSYTMNGSSVNYTSPVPTYKACLSFKIKDKAAFDKVMQAIVKQEILASPAPGMYSLGGFATLAANGAYGAVSNDPAVASAFLVSPGRSDFNIPSDVKNNPYGFYADIKNSIKSVPLDLLYGKEDTGVFHDARNLLDNIKAYGGKVQDDHSDFHFELSFQNKDENALMQLINFTKKVADAEQRESASFDEVIPDEDTSLNMVDTAAI